MAAMNTEVLETAVPHTQGQAASPPCPPSLVAGFENGTDLSLIHHSLWRLCDICPQVRRCPDPFPTAGVCVASESPSIPVQAESKAPDYAPYMDWRQYTGLLLDNRRAAAIYARSKRGLDLTVSDFLYLRELILNGPETIADNPALCLLGDMFLPMLDRLTDDYSSYLGIDRPDVAACVVSTWSEIVRLSNPDIVAQSLRVGLDIGMHLREAAKGFVWLSLGCPSLNLSALDEKEFRQQFEVEWKRLKAYRDTLNGFRIMPVLHYKELVRYQYLKRGDKSIRLEISSHFAFLLAEYPTFMRAWVPDFGDRFFAPRLRIIFAPLVGHIVNTALKRADFKKDRNATIGSKSFKADVEELAWQAFDEALEQFEFHRPYKGNGNPSPLGNMSILGISESQEDRDSFDAYLQSGGWRGICDLEHMRADRTDDLAFAGKSPDGHGSVNGDQEGCPYESLDFANITLARYIDVKLRKWLNELYPPEYTDPRSRTHLSLENLDESANDITRPEAIYQEAPALVSADGVAYFTIRQVANRYGVTEHQLRYLDKQGYYKPMRAEDLNMAHASLPPKLRLYADTEIEREKLRIALQKVRDRASGLRSGEFTRTQVAKVAGIAVGKLRRWEQQGLLNPRRSGRSVVYAMSDVHEVKRLLSPEVNGEREIRRNVKM